MKHYKNNEKSYEKVMNMKIVQNDQNFLMVEISSGVEISTVEFSAGRVLKT